MGMWVWVFWSILDQKEGMRRPKVSRSGAAWITYSNEGTLVAIGPMRTLPTLPLACSRSARWPNVRARGPHPCSAVPWARGKISA